jgi:hypothetical protein
MQLPAHKNPLVTEEVSEEEKRSEGRYVHYRDRENLTTLKIPTHSTLVHTEKVGWKQGTALGNGNRAVLSLQQRDETEQLLQCGLIVDNFNWIINKSAPTSNRTHYAPITKPTN